MANLQLKAFCPFTDHGYMSSYMFKLSYGADINMRAEISFTIGVVTFDVIRLLITFVNFRLGTVTKESE